MPRAGAATDVEIFRPGEFRTLHINRTVVAARRHPGAHRAITARDQRRRPRALCRQGRRTERLLGRAAGYLGEDCCRWAAMRFDPPRRRRCWLRPAIRTASRSGRRPRTSRRCCRSWKSFSPARQGRHQARHERGRPPDLSQPDSQGRGAPSCSTARPVSRSPITYLSEFFHSRSHDRKADRGDKFLALRGQPTRDRGGARRRQCLQTGSPCGSRRSAEIKERRLRRAAVRAACRCWARSSHARFGYALKGAIKSRPADHRSDDDRARADVGGLHGGAAGRRDDAEMFPLHLASYVCCARRGPSDEEREAAIRCVLDLLARCSCRLEAPSRSRDPSRRCRQLRREVARRFGSADRRARVYRRGLAQRIARVSAGPRRWRSASRAASRRCRHPDGVSLVSGDRRLVR